MVSFQKIILVPAIAANGIKQYLFSSKELRAGIRKYGYYNTIIVMNGSEMDIELEVELCKKFPIPAGNIINKGNIRYESFNVKNLNTAHATPADVVEIICSVEGI